MRAKVVAWLANGTTSRATEVRAIATGPIPRAMLATPRSGFTTALVKVAAAGALWSLAAVAAAQALKVSCAGSAAEVALCKSAVAEWSVRSGVLASVVDAPADANERLKLYQRQFEERSDAADVLQIDAPWTGLLQQHLLDLRPHSGGVQNNHLGGAVANNTVDGRLIAMPWFIDAGLLFYRKDLLAKHGLKAPRTWGELQSAAERVQAAERAAGNDRMWGYVWQGRNYEGLTCDALEWWLSFGAGTFVDQGGKVTANNPRAVKALETAVSWVGHISPPEVLKFGEEEARAAFQSGHAVFMRNWPYAWAAAQAEGSPIRGKVAVTVLPKSSGEGGRFGATLGGQQLAVSKYSKNTAAAAQLVMYLTSAEVQKNRAIKGAFNPTLWPLYSDPDILKANPFMGELFGVLAFATARPAAPTGRHYFAVSQAIATSVHRALSGQVSAAAAVEQIEKDLMQAGGRHGWR